jgi:hypothetical protein
MGQAAGTAAAMADDGGVRVDIAALQARLRSPDPRSNRTDRLT